ncbi:sushi domain-containing protein 3-like [Ranitomeya imitator]|uniref:sushi domain-containing protein 3-like n=1 Tax=Ranitomeya imitator TaxID=111125 RepID=UPI0037E8EFA2
MIPIMFYTFYIILPGINASGDAEGGNKTLDAEIPPAPNSSAVALCPVLVAPPGGSFHMSDAEERFLGSVAIFSCQDGFQLLGFYKLRCQKKGDDLQWNHQEPQCQAVSLTPNKGFRLALIISLVSCFIIITMFVAFTVCCVRERQLSLQQEAAWGRSAPNPGFFMETPVRFGGNSFHPDPPQESGLYRSVYFKGPNGFENCGFQT